MMKPSEAMNLLTDLQDWIATDYNVEIKEAGAIAYGLIAGGWVTDYPEGWDEDND